MAKNKKETENYGIFGSPIERANAFIDNALKGINDEAFGFVPDDNAVLDWEDMHVVGELIDRPFHKSSDVGNGAGITAQLIHQDTMKVLYQKTITSDDYETRQKIGIYKKEVDVADGLVKKWLKNLEEEYHEAFEDKRSIHPKVAETFDNAEIVGYGTGIYGKKFYIFRRVYIVIFNY